MAVKIITGAALRKGGLEWVSLRQLKDRVDNLDQRAVLLPGDPLAPLDFASPELAAQLKTICSDIKGDFCLALPSDKVLLRVLDLPTVDPLEMQGMVDLQVDKYSPFPIEHMVVSFEVVSKQEASVRVLVAAVQRTVVESVGQAFLKVGVIPHRIDVEAQAWWSLLKTHGKAPAKIVPGDTASGAAVESAGGQRIFLLLDDLNTQLIISQDDVPVVFRSLGPALGMEREEYLQNLVEEIDYTLTSRETEWGDTNVDRIGVWYSGTTPPDDLAERLQTACGMPVDVHSLDLLPPLGEAIARRGLAAAGGEPKLNLALAEWGQAERTRVMKKNLLIGTTAFLSVWLLTIAVFLFLLGWQRNRLAGLKTEVEAVEQPAIEVRRLVGKVKNFEQYVDRTHSALECLREVSEVLPDNVLLTSFTYKKGSILSLRGEAPTANEVYDFIDALEKSTLFEYVKPEGGVTTRMQNNVSKAQFGVILGLPGDKT